MCLVGGWGRVGTEQTRSHRCLDGEEGWVGSEEEYFSQMRVGADTQNMADGAAQSGFVRVSISHLPLCFLIRCATPSSRPPAMARDGAPLLRCCLPEAELAQPEVALEVELAMATRSASGGAQAPTWSDLEERQLWRKERRRRGARPGPWRSSPSTAARSSPRSTAELAQAGGSNLPAPEVPILASAVTTRRGYGSERKKKRHC